MNKWAENHRASSSSLCFQVSVGRVYPSLAMELKSVVYSFGVEFFAKFRRKVEITLDPFWQIHMDEKRTSHIKNQILEARFDEPTAKEATGSKYTDVWNFGKGKF